MSVLPVSAPLEGFWQLVHGPLAYWAQQRPDAIALGCEAGAWAFVPGDFIKCILCAIIVHTGARGMPDWRFGGRR